MRLRIFTIYDSKAKAYLRPFILPSAVHAIREIAEVLQRPGPFSDYPEHFQLFETGEFDDDTGEVQPLLRHESHGSLLSIGAELRSRREANARQEAAT